MREQVAFTSFGIDEAWNFHEVSGTISQMMGKARARAPLGAVVTTILNVWGYNVAYIADFTIYVGRSCAAARLRGIGIDFQGLESHADGAEAVQGHSGIPQHHRWHQVSRLLGIST